MKLPQIGQYCFSHGKKAWFLNHVNDQYVKKAQSLGFRSRASFKLLQIQQKFSLFHKTNSVLDLGSAPGSWSQAIKTINPQAKVVAVDLLPMKELEGVDFYQTDARSALLHKLLREKYGSFDAIISDMAPNFSGTLFQTHQEGVQLNRCCIELVLTLGSPECLLVMKTVEGPLQRSLQWILEYFYSSVVRFKPKSSRSESVEHYLICRGLKVGQNKDEEVSKFKQIEVKNVKKKKDVEEMMVTRSE